MINTINTKIEQLQKGYFSIGTGDIKMLIMGSCRTIAYVNYYSCLNKNNTYTIYFIDPFNFNWDLKDNVIDYKKLLLDLEENENLTSMLKNVNIFIHEYYSHVEMFNCDKNAIKNIYQFGLLPDIDIILPNFNNIFLLTKDIVLHDTIIHKKALEDYSNIKRLSEETLNEIKLIKQRNFDEFYSICLKTSFPEFAEIFKQQYKLYRFFWTSNHVTAKFNQILFDLINKKYLDTDVLEEDFVLITKHDLFSHNYTPLSEYDEEYVWKEVRIPLVDSLSVSLFPARHL